MPDPNIVSFQPDFGPLLTGYAALNAEEAKRVTSVKAQAQEMDRAAKAESKAIDDLAKKYQKEAAAEEVLRKKQADYLLKLQLNSAKLATQEALAAEERVAEIEAVTAAEETEAALSTHKLAEIASELRHTAGAAKIFNEETGGALGEVRHLILGAEVAMKAFGVTSYTALAEVLGPIGLVASAASALFYVYEQGKEDAEEYAKATEKVKDAEKEAVESSDRLRDAIDDLRDSEAKANGMTSEQISARKELKTISEAAADSVVKATLAQRAQEDVIGRLDEKYRKLGEGLKDADASVRDSTINGAKLKDGYAEQTKRLDAYNHSLEVAKQKQKDAKAEAERNIATIDREAAATAKEKKDKADLTAARQANTAATKEETAAEREAHEVGELQLKLLLHEVAAYDKKQAAYTTAKTELDKLHDASVKANAGEEERIHIEAQAARQAATTAAAEAQAAADSSDKRKAIARELQATLAGINEQEVADVRKAEDQKEAATKAADKAILQAKLDALDRYESAADNLTSATQGLLDQLEANEIASAERGNAAKKKAAKRAFQITKQLAASEAVVEGAQAAQKTLGDLGLPAAIPFLIADAVATGLNVAKIESAPPPTFSDTPPGGVVAQASSGYQTMAFKDKDKVFAAQNTVDALGQVLTRLSAESTHGRGPVSRSRPLAEQDIGLQTQRLLTRDVWRITRGGRPPL